MATNLNPAEPQKTQYCVSLWQRDAQVAAAIARPGVGRLQPVIEARSGPVAVVCFGPSLNDTWEKIRDFECVITCSGAHRFCVDRQIIPNFHVEVDPRRHKVELIGPPQQETTYLIASTCHAAVFDHLEGYDVKLWHVFDSAAEGIRVLPQGEWAVTGGCSVGLRALTIAGFLGFRDLHVFGMDGSSGATGKHAAPHPNQPKGDSECEYPPGSGQMWRTTPGMLAAAQGTWHELDQMPRVRATFYGEGLVQAMAKDYKPKPKDSSKAFENVVGFQKPVSITPEYAELNRKLHESNVAYGVGGGKHAATVLKLCESLKTRNVLDFGCGKAELGKALPFGICEFDPAIPGKDASPRPADIVVATDVLEHVEPELIDNVLNDLRRLVLRCGYFTIHTGPAMKTLADGRNAHVLQKPRSWWEQKLSKFFTIGQIVERLPELYIVVGPKITKLKSKPKEQAA